MDYGVPMKQWPQAATRAWKHGELTENRNADYQDYGGPKGLAKRIGGYREDDQYDSHAAPVQVSEFGGELHVGDGHHRAYDAIARKVKHVPVEWV